jgi:hypothetical protein
MRCRRTEYERHLADETQRKHGSDDGADDEVLHHQHRDCPERQRQRQRNANEANQQHVAPRQIRRQSRREGAHHSDALQQSTAHSSLKL